MPKEIDLWVASYVRIYSEKVKINNGLIFSA